MNCTTDREVMIVAAGRTPVGDFQGSLSSLSAIDLGVQVTKAVMQRAKISPEMVEELVCGNLYKHGLKGNPGRQIQLASGIPSSAFASTIDQQCSSGMKAIEMISQQILLGRTDCGVATGIESMSNIPYLLQKARTGYRMGNDQLVDAMLNDGLVCAMCNYHMGITAENLAEKYSITREEQDALALLSHDRALAAQESNAFADQMIPVEITSKKGTTIVDKDEHPRRMSLDILAKAKPAFKKDGTVTALNASGVNDGASALVLMSAKSVKSNNLEPIGRIVSTASYGVEPQYMGIGPVYAIPRVLKFAGLEMKDISYFEINEAFAAQFLACNKELKIDMDKVNAHGSGVGLGHPVGCTGARIVCAVLYELKRRGQRYGVASLCVGGGPAMAVVVEAF